MDQKGVRSRVTDRGSRTARRARRLTGMAVRTWANTLGIGAGAGVLTGAGQLGIGYGLGILRWQQFPSSESWHAQLTWIAFLSAVAVVAGGYAGLWHARRM